MNCPELQERGMDIGGAMFFSGDLVELFSYHKVLYLLAAVVFLFLLNRLGNPPKRD